MKVERLRVALIFMLAVKQWVHSHQPYLKVRVTGGVTSPEDALGVLHVPNSSKSSVGLDLNPSQLFSKSLANLLVLLSKLL